MILLLVTIFTNANSRVPPIITPTDKNNIKIIISVLFNLCFLATDEAYIPLEKTPHNTMIENSPIFRPNISTKGNIGKIYSL
jgi:hypothetical protein